MQNYQQTIIKQFGNSPTINQLLSSFNGYIDPTANLDAFYNYIWNVETAQGYGLDVWGRIVGVSRVLQVASGVYLGFAEAADSAETPFNQAPFYAGEEATSNYALTDDAFRILIYAKALFNIGNGSTASINNILMTVFGVSGASWVIDNLNLTMVYHFNFVPSPVDSAIIYQSGVLPRPCGVSATVTHL